MTDGRPVGTRCSVPRAPDPLVARPRLERVLADGERRRLTLVAGPPGAGKTTLLASWRATAAPERTAWLTLDAGDDEPERLAALVVTALADGGCIPAAGPTGEPGAAAGEGTALVALDAALDEVGRRGRRCVLVLDDVQELSSRPALATLARIVDWAPESLDVVLSSRADPPLRLERLRLDGRLAEVRYRDLSFTCDEAAELFAAHGLDLSASQTRALWELVEGWAAGLRLGAVALQSEDDPGAFVANAAATQAAAADYLLGEVLIREDEDAQRFLLHTSVADRLLPELAVALTGDPDAGDKLADLERRGLFLMRLDDRQCYRYHALFRALLRARLRQREPRMVAELHRRAAAWCVAEGLEPDAEAHGRTAEDWPFVGRLILRRWLSRATEEADPLAAGPLAGISAGVLLDTPELALVAAAEACRWADQHDADLYRGALAGGPSTPGPAGPVALDDGAVWDMARRLLDLTYAWTFGTDARAVAAAHQVAGLDAPEPWTPLMRQLADLARAEMDMSSGDLDRARVTLETLADHGEPEWHRVLAGAVLAVLDAAAGNVPAAVDRLDWVADRLGTGAQHPATPRYAQVAAALCAAQRGGPRGVAEALGAPGTAQWSSASLRAVHAALQAATRGRAPFFVSLDPRTAGHPLAERALLALGVLEVVDARGRPIAIGGEGERAVAAARHQLAGAGAGTAAGVGAGAGAGSGVPGRAGGAGVVPVAVATLVDRSVPRHPRTAVEGAVLAAVAAEHGHAPEAAGALLGEALELAEATGIRAPLLEHGPALGGVLERIAGDRGARAAAALDLLDLAQHPGGDELVEPLTEREIEVLQHLPTLMSNTQIAQGLHVSVNTVKTHLKAVYRKLGVDGRREAVLRGRELELL